MITLLGSLLGFLVGIFPKIMRFINKKKDLSHELAVLDRQMDSMRDGHFMRCQEISLRGAQAEQVALLKSVRPSKIRWVEGLASSVRPVLTYAFFILYVAVKVAQFLIIKEMGATWISGLVQIWSIEDETLFAAVMSFWFGSRAMTKGRRA